MNEFTLNIVTENAPFDPDAFDEVARILRELADKIERQRPDAGQLRDINGNFVGKFSF